MGFDGGIILMACAILKLLLSFLLFVPYAFASQGRAVAGAPSTLTIASGAGSASGVLEVPVAISKVSSLGTENPILVDGGPPSARPKIVFTYHSRSDIADERIFYFITDLTDIPQGSVFQNRSATLSIGRLALASVSFTLASRGVSQSTLKVMLPSDWSARSAALPITVTTGELPVTNLAILTGFVESATRSPLPGNSVVLCADESDACSSDVSIPANSSATIYLRYRGPVRPGIYAGEIRLSSPGSISDASRLTLYISSVPHLVGGVLVVLLGAFLAWWVKTYVSNRITRDQALLPVTLYHDHLVANDAILNRVSGQLGIKIPNLSAAVKNWLAQLNPQLLEVEHGLPASTPSPFVKVSSISSDYTTFLANADAAVTLLSVFIVQGVEQVAVLTENGKIPSPQAPKVVSAIDNFYAPNITVDAALPKIQSFISTARTLKVEASPTEGSVSDSSLSLNRMIVEIRRLNVTAWCILLGAACIGTILTLVLKPGFGRASDYLLCFATAFGIPIVGGAAIPSQTAGATVTKLTQSVSGSSGSLGT
jgi:hypothetical protein